MAQDADSRLTKLETTVEHQANTIDEMSAVITEQWQTIERMQRKLDALASRFVALEEQTDTANENTKPPHW
jgi:SlyX protein